MTPRDKPDYQRMSIVEKQATTRESWREGAVACPACETACQPAELTWREAHALGVSRATLSRFVARGLVRARVRARGKATARLYGPHPPMGSGSGPCPGAPLAGEHSRGRAIETHRSRCSRSSVVSRGDRA